MNGSLETVALKWDAIIRETAEKTLNVIFPDLDRSGMAYVKLQMLLRNSLLEEAEKIISEAGDAEPSDIDNLLFEMRPPLMEELIPPITPPMEQAELAMFLMRLLEEKDAFLPLLSETMDTLPLDGRTSKFQITGELLKTASDRFRLNAAAAGADKQPQKKMRLCFPEGYPYMDEFEYSDHCIAGE